MYQILKEISGLYKYYRGKTPKVFIEPSDDSKTAQLLNEILSKTSENEADLAKKLGYKSESDKSYMVLRKYLHEKLLNLCFYLNPETLYQNPYMIQYYTSYKNLFISKVLFSIGFYTNAEKIAESTIKLAKRFEFWEIISSLSTTLSDYHAARGNAVKSRSYYNLADKAIVKQRNERRIKSFINEMNIYFSRQTTASSEVYTALIQYLNEAEQICKNDNAFNSNYYLYRLKVIQYQATFQYQNAIQACDEGIEYISKADEMFVSLRMGIMLGTKMHCFLNLRDFESANKFAKESESYFVPGTQNWYVINEYYYVLSLQTKNFETAYLTLKKVIDYPGFERLPTARKEKWQVLRAHMEFLQHANIWQLSNVQVIDSKFRLNKFINDVPVFQRDKKGVNISILILQILFLLINKDYTGIIDRKEALTRYIRRHLATKQNERSRVFMTLLSKMIIFNFNGEKVEYKTKKLRKQLGEEVYNYATNMGGNEILDFEMLWEWVIKELKKNKP